MISDHRSTVPLGSPSPGCIRPCAIRHPFGRALGVNRGCGRGRVRPERCSADHHPPTVGGERTAGGTGNMAARDGALTGLHDPAPTADLLVQIFDPVGRPRGTGFAADPEGTLVTSHEAVDGAARLLVRAGDAVTEVTGAAITPLPRLGLALLHTRGLGAPRPCRSPHPGRSAGAPTSGSPPAAGARHASSARPPSRTPRRTDPGFSTEPWNSPSARPAPTRCAPAGERRAAPCSTRRPAPSSASSAPPCTPRTGRPGSRSR